MKAKAALLILGLALAACSADTTDQETAAEPETGESNAQPMVDAMDDAKAVEDQVMQQKEDIDAALDEAEQTLEDAEESLKDAAANE